MKILVTGGAGFIASHITDAYITAGHTVVVLDNLVHGFKRNLNPKAKFCNVDICDLNQVRKIIQREKPTVINHHAAIAEVVKSVTDPVPTLETNVQGTVNLLLAGSEVKIKKFLFASTGGAIYGEANKYPITEKTLPAPLSPYGLSKQLAEECIKYYANIYKFPYLIFRYPNVYGPRQDPHGEAGVVAIFARTLRSQQSPTIFGDGTKTRDYVYVKDIAQVNVLGLRKGNNVTVNLGLGKEITDYQVYATIAQQLPNVPSVKYKAIRAGEIMRSCLNAAQAKKILGWKPQYSFEEGVKEYLTTGPLTP